MDRLARSGLITLVICACLTTVTNAQSDPQSAISITPQTGIDVRGDFQVGPTRFVLEMNPGEQRTIEVQLISREGAERDYDVSVEDFAVTDDGTDAIQFYPNASGPFSAQSWVRPAVSTLRLRHGERATIPVTVTVPASADTGDHYSVVLFERASNAATQGGFNIVSRVGALLLITVQGDIVREGELDLFDSAQPLYWSTPAQLSVRYRNTGTVHLVPVGSIVIRNMFGMTVDDIPVKDWYVLRNSLRRREILWHPKFAFGRYTATLTLNSAGHATEEVATASFWLIPLLPLLGIIVTVLLLSFLLRSVVGRYELRRKG